MHLVHDVEQQMRNFVRTIRAVAKQSTDVDIRKVRVSAAIGCRDADFRWRGMVVELDEETFQQLAGALLRQRAVGQSPFVERQQMLVEMAGVERIPTVQL